MRWRPFYLADSFADFSAWRAARRLRGAAPQGYDWQFFLHRFLIVSGRVVIAPTVRLTYGRR
jgi:hypothetical protein